MDYFAIATQGFYPEPTPTDAERMALASTWGHLTVVPTSAADEYALGLMHLNLGLEIN